MRINYNIDHTLLDLPVFNGLKNHDKRATLIALSCILHFTEHVGQCHFYQGQMAADWDITDRYWRNAIKLLVEHDYIKCIQQYSAQTQTPAVYQASTGYRRSGHKLYTRRPQAVDPSYRVNNSKELLKGKENSFSNSLPKGEIQEDFEFPTETLLTKTI